MKDKRELTVYYNNTNRPMIILQGKWMEELGYKVGDKITVDIKNNEIKIKKAGE